MKNCQKNIKIKHKLCNTKQNQTATVRFFTLPGTEIFPILTLKNINCFVSILE